MFHAVLLFSLVLCNNNCKLLNYIHCVDIKLNLLHHVILVENHLCVYTCVPVCVCLRVCLHARLCACLCVSVCMCVCLYVCVRASLHCVSGRACKFALCVCVRACLFVCVFVFASHVLART